MNRQPNSLKNFLLSMVISCFWLSSMAQDGIITGVVSDASGPLIGATVLVKGVNKGTVTDVNGDYSISVRAGEHEVECSFVGYNTESAFVTVASGGITTLNFLLAQGVFVDEVVITGTRASNRTNTDSPVPVDVINVDKLTGSAPQTNLNQILHYSAPSFSSNTQTISDGTDHIDPASLRGLGPDQVLVLINGKRRHSSSLVNVNGTFGRGNVGTDLNAIPAAAIESIEVLRDGAAAQYGSDAIAGVINLKLRSDVNKLRFTLNTGANFTKNASPNKDVDGGEVVIGANYGLPLGKQGGFINLTGSFNYRDWTNRMQEFTGSIFNGYNSVEWVAANDGADLSNLSLEDLQTYGQQVTHFSSDLKNMIANAPDIDSMQTLLNFNTTDAELAVRGQQRSDYNMRIGQSALRGGQFMGNFSLPVSDNMELYSFGGIGYREGESGCFYRLPNQNRTYTPTYINGFLPLINSQITDKSLATGIRGMIRDWHVDLSNTYGSNQFLYQISQTHNATMQNASPLIFDAGGHVFQQNTGNLDIVQYFNGGGFPGVNVAFGAEYRFENYEVIPGTEFSWGNYDVFLELVTSTTPASEMPTDFFARSRPSGAQCFAGFLPSNEINANRSSVAGYLDTEWDLTEAFLLSGAVRFENYSDFGSTFNYKAAARYKITDDIALRAAHSTGFRAPSLHQIYFSRTSTIFTTINNQTVAQEIGIFNNQSRAARLLGIPSLKEETSQNFSAGLTVKMPEAGLRVTIDGYLINIDDRIVLTGQFAPGNDAELRSIFSQAQADAAAFFANAIDTKSRGLDIVASHRTMLGTGSLTNNLAATFAKTEQDGDIHASELLERKGLVDTYFNEESRIYLEEAVPRTKITLSHSLDLGMFNIYLRNTYFGETTEATNISALDPDVDYTYSGKVITDLSFGYQFAPNLSLTIGANNLLDIYPDEADPTFQSDGRFIYSRRSPQWSLNGRYLFARVAFTLQ